jgi:hypothetical protein
MTTLQCMRATLAALADVATFGKGLAMSREPGAEGAPPPPPLAQFRQRFDVVFLDAGGWVNLAARLSKSGLAQVRPSPNALTLSMRVRREDACVCLSVYLSIYLSVCLLTVHRLSLPFSLC